MIEYYIAIGVGALIGWGICAFLLTISNNLADIAIQLRGIRNDRNPYT